MIIRVASRVTEQLKTYDLLKWENFNKISEMLGTHGKALNQPFSTVLLKDCKKSAVKYSLEKPILLNFVDYFGNVLFKIVVLYVLQLLVIVIVSFIVSHVFWFNYD